MTEEKPTITAPEVRLVEVDGITGLRVGESFDEFRIEKLIGRGGLSEVYLADDTRTNTQVALKFLLPERLSDLISCERLRKEARSMIRFRTGGTVFFTSQPCECGRTSIRLLGVQGRLDGMKSIEDVSVAVLLLPADTLPRVNHKAKWVDDRRSGVWG